MLELYGLHTGGIDYGNRPHVVTFYDYTEFVGRLIRQYSPDGDDTQPIEVDTYTIERDNLIILKREAAETNKIEKNYDYFILRNFIKDVTPTIRIYDYDFFIVDRIEKRSGKIYYYCHKDLWAYGQARLFNSTLHVTKSNKHLTYGVFDDIKLLTATKFIENLQTYSDNFNPQYIKGDDIMVVFKAQFKTAITTYESTEQVGLFAFSPKALRNALIDLINDITPASDPTMFNDLRTYVLNTNALLLAMDVVGGIYSIKGSSNLEAKVLDAWVVDKRLLNVTWRELVFNTNGLLSWPWPSGYQVQPWTLGVTQIVPKRQELTITRPQFSTLSNREFLGTEESNLELTRYVDAYQAKITCITSNSNLQILAECGSEKVDITSAFHLNVVTSDAELSQEKTAKILNFAFGTLKGGLNLSSKNDARGLVTGGINWGASIAEDAYKFITGEHNKVGGNMGEGDAMKNFIGVPYNPNGQSTDYEFLNPYKVIKFASPALTELRHAGLEGVNYDLFMNLSDILNASLLEQDIITSEGASISPITTFTYLKVDNLNLSFRYGQSEVYDFIQKELLRGVYLIDITNA